MKSKIYQILFVLTWAFVCLVPTVAAADIADLKGRVTAGINLRAAPGLSGKVITGLEAGTVVVVTGEQAGWYQIAYEDETYGYRGWVYGKYIELLAAPAAPVTPVVQPEAPQPMPVMPPPPLPVQPSQAQATAVEAHTRPAEMPANTIELIQAAAPPAPEVANQTAAGPAAATAPTSVAQAASAPAKPQRIASQTDPKPAPASGRSSYPGPGPGNLLSIVLKISSVFLSCLALLISYRTFQMVTATGRTT